MPTIQKYNIGAARTDANTQNGDLYSISQPLKKLLTIDLKYSILDVYQSPDYVSIKISKK